jgi:hypothetical protein|tara:strand:- start:386 stop:817 length:432 start_codon:yes stop_codon:yes gene_type:complete
MSEKKRTFNPIDPDKIAEDANILPYGSSVSAPAFKAVDVLKNKSLDVNAMEMQTNMQLDQIRAQIELLAEQAQKIQRRKELSEHIYNAQMGFKPEINHTYYLYQKENVSTVLSMIGPQEWKKCPYDFLHKVLLLADHTWDIVE